MPQVYQNITDGAASNTALDSQSLVPSPLSAHIDWISLSFKVSGSRRLDKLIGDIQDMLQISIFFDQYRIKDDFTGRYKSYGGTLGCTFSYTHGNPDDIFNARITLPGDFLASRKPWHIKRVMRRLSHDYGALCTRIDLAVDDYDKQLDYDVIINASKNKEGVGFQVGKSIESYGNASAGRTVYCGTRRSPKYARFYNKGDRDRFEVEYKQGLATAIFADYLDCDSPDSVDVLSSILRGSISFGARRDKNLARAVIHSWWSDFQNRIIGTSYKFVRPKPRPSLDRTLSWIHRSVSKSLLIAREALGTDALNKLLELWEHEARARCDRSDIDKIHQFNLNPLSLNELMSMI